MASETRGLIELMVVGVGLAVLGASIIWSRRRLLRRWHLMVPALMLFLSVPPTITLGRDIRTHAGGDAAAWGRMGELIILMGLLPVLCIAGGALLAALVALRVHGLASDEDLAHARASRGPWYRPLIQPRSREQTLARLYVSLGALIVVGVLWLLGVRPGR